jgi:NAD-dependent deacetylase
MNFIKKLFSSSKLTVIDTLYQPRLLVFSGAGLSADSGIPTYRGNSQSGKSLWTQYEAKKYSNYKNWYENKEELFSFWNDRKSEIFKSGPNIAHFGLTQLQKDYGDSVILATQNVDNLLEKSGAKNVLHVHGDLENMDCKDCNHSWFIGSKPYSHIEKCPLCFSNHVKPAIVLFGESAPKYKELTNIFNFRKINKHDIILCLGTSFKVCKLDNIIGYGEYQPGFKILVNYEEQPSIPNERFDNVFYGNVVDNWENIDNLIRFKMKKINL